MWSCSWRRISWSRGRGVQVLPQMCNTISKPDVLQELSKLRRSGHDTAPDCKYAYCNVSWDPRELITYKIVIHWLVGISLWDLEGETKLKKSRITHKAQHLNIEPQDCDQVIWFCWNTLCKKFLGIPGHEVPVHCKVCEQMTKPTGGEIVNQSKIVEHLANIFSLVKTKQMTKPSTLVCEQRDINSILSLFSNRDQFQKSTCAKPNRLYILSLQT